MPAKELTLNISQKISNFVLASNFEIWICFLFIREAKLEPTESTRSAYDQKWKNIELGLQDVREACTSIGLNRVFSQLSMELIANVKARASLSLAWTGGLRNGKIYNWEIWNGLLMMLGFFYEFAQKTKTNMYLIVGRIGKWAGEMKWDEWVITHISLFLPHDMEAQNRILICHSLSNGDGTT